MSKRVLIHAFSPSHILASLCAVKTLHGHEAEATVAVYWPGADTAMQNEMEESVRAMTSGFHFVKTVVTLSTETVSCIAAMADVDATHQLRKCLGSEHYDEIYYAHDVSGVLYPLLACVYPDAKRICYGDGFGFVYERRVHLAHLGICVDGGLRLLYKKLKNRVRRFVKKTPFFLGEFKPHLAALVMPVDQSGNFLAHLPLMVCGKDTALEVICQCAASCEELSRYITELMSIYKDNEINVLLTDNIAEGGFMELDEEAEMYCSVVREHCSAGSTVFIKSHPGEVLPRNDKIKERLSGDYVVVELEPRFRRYPIEIWQGLLTGSKIICLSSPVLSLKYFYGIDVIQPMDGEFVEKWFPERYWASYKNSISLYMGPLRALDGWDGQSVLWAGNNTNRG